MQVKITKSRWGGEKYDLGVSHDGGHWIVNEYTLGELQELAETIQEFLGEIINWMRRGE